MHFLEDFWSANCDTSKVDRETTFATADTKLFILVVILSSQGKTNLFKSRNCESIVYQFSVKVRLPDLAE